MTRCTQCGGDLDTGMRCVRCQPQSTVTAPMPDPAARPPRPIPPHTPGRHIPLCRWCGREGCDERCIEKANDPAARVAEAMLEVQPCAKHAKMSFTVPIPWHCTGCMAQLARAALAAARGEVDADIRRRVEAMSARSLADLADQMSGYATAQKCRVYLLRALGADAGRSG